MVLIPRVCQKDAIDAKPSLSLQRFLTLGEFAFVTSVSLDPQAPRFLAGAVLTQATGRNPIPFQVLQVN